MLLKNIFRPPKYLPTYFNLDTLYIPHFFQEIFHFSAKSSREPIKNKNIPIILYLSFFPVLHVLGQSNGFFFLAMVFGLLCNVITY